MWIQARDTSDLIDEPENEIVEGAMEQGIDLATIDDHIRLNAFGYLQATRDDEALDWNRKVVYALGGKLRYTGLERTLISLGARYDTEERTVSDSTKHGITAFLNWASYWNLSEWTGTVLGARATPGTTWGALRYPSSHFGEEVSNTILEGAIEQGIDLSRFSEKATFNAFLRLEYALDTKGFDWNNKVKGGPGAKVKLTVGKQGLLELGAQYRWHHRFESNRTESGPVLFINWSLAWDFGEFAQKSY